MADVREQAVQALQHADHMSGKLATVKDSGVVSALTGIGYALVYVGDAIKSKYEPPF